MWAFAFEMSFPFRYEMGSPGVFEEIVNSSDEGGCFEEKEIYDWQQYRYLIIL